MDNFSYCDGGDDKKSLQKSHLIFECMSSKNVRENRLIKNQNTTSKEQIERTKSNKSGLASSNSSFEDDGYISENLSPENKRFYNEDNEFFEQCVDLNQNGDSSNDSNKDDDKFQNEKKFSVIPPPHPLLPKSLFPIEPVRSGGPIQFLKLTYAKTGSNIQFEKQTTDDKSMEIKELEQMVLTKGKRPFKTIFTQDLRSCEINPIVYSRYSKSEYNASDKIPEEPWSSCIVNIK